MREEDFDSFVQLLAAEAEIRSSKPLSEGALLLWWQRLARFDLAQIRRALERHAGDLGPDHAKGPHGLEARSLHQLHDKGHQPRLFRADDVVDLHDANARGVAHAG